MFLFYFTFILLNVIQVDSSLDACRQTFGSNKYDLNRLSHLTLFGDETLFRYAFTPCGLVPTDKCGQSTTPFEPGMTACQERISSTSFESAMGFLDGYGKTPNLEFNENPQGPGTGVVMTMRNALCNGRERLVKAIFICDKSIKNPTKMDVVEDPTCQFTITIKASEACPVNGGGSGGGMTGGTVFFIILLVLIIIYVLGVMLYNRFQNQQTGLAMLPHPSFWVLLFGLFVIGCKFSWNFVRSCGRDKSSSPGAYNSV